MVAARLPQVNEQQAVYERVLKDVGGRQVVFARSTLVATGFALSPVKSGRKPGHGLARHAYGTGPARLDPLSVARPVARHRERELSIMFRSSPHWPNLRQARTAVGGCPAGKIRTPRTGAHQVGTMLEVPALVWQLDQLLRDRFSVGRDE